MQLIVNGTFAAYTEKMLASKDYYKDYISGKINTPQFREAMLADDGIAGYAGFHNAERIAKIAKMPPDEKIPAEVILGYLADNKIIAGCENIYDGFEEFRKRVYANYNHAEYITYAAPEDERLMYAVSKLARAKRIFAGGSYYGYLAVWAMQTVHHNGGTAILADIDQKACELAGANFKKLGFEKNTEICCEDAGIAAARYAEPVDLLILDATGLPDDARPEYRGKRIYGALFKAAKHLLKKGSFIFIHNMEPENPDMKALVDELDAVNARGTSYETFNGLGLYVVL